ncbi:MAG: signal peptide peptidase SppA [Spirochaetia bacterium]
MKRLLFCILFVGTILCSYAADVPEFRYPVAASENFFAIVNNPALLSARNISGLGLGVYSESWTQILDNQPLAFYINSISPFLSSFHAYRDGVWQNTVNLSFPLIRNLYFGAGAVWDNLNFGTARYHSSMLFRPMDFVSLGVRVNQNADETMDKNIGIALRPLAFTAGSQHRLTVYSDIQMDNSFTFTNPLIGASIEPIDGLLIDGFWETDTSNISLTVAARMGTTQTEIENSLNTAMDYSGFRASLFFSSHRYEGALDNMGNTFMEFQELPELTESPYQTGGDFMVFDTPTITVQSFISEIRSIAEDETIEGLIFNNNLISTDSANFLEILEALQYAKEQGKSIIFYFEYADLMNYILAAAVADAIYLNPAGSVYITGMSSTNIYLADLFTEYGIEVINYQSHEYKTAYNSFTESDMTDAERESITAVLESLQITYETALSNGRGNALSAAVEEIFSHGPYLIADQAHEAGLVDGLLYDDDLLDTIREQIPDTNFVFQSFTEAYRQDWADDYLNQVAVIYATGAIHTGRGTPGETIGSDTLVQAIRNARNNPNIRGIILRVNSGGGSTLASNIIAREIRECTQGDNPIPVVVSMGSAAASGGYYISCYADRIVANENTITGSIGVITIDFSILGLLDMLNIETESVAIREMSHIQNPLTEITEEEQEALQAAIGSYYETFVNAVAEGREMSYDEVHEIARGRIWTGAQAVENGLIDTIGSFRTAVDEMEELLNTDEIELILFDAYQMQDIVNPSIIVSAFSQEFQPQTPLNELYKQAELLSTFRPYEPLSIMLYSFSQ